MDPRIRLSEELVAAGAVGGASGRTRDDGPARLAASVILLREALAGMEIALLSRASTMEFAAGRPVFPGGRVDATDGEAITSWAGPPLDWWSQQLEVDANTAQAIVVAAVRETFEETGVLLAAPTDDTPAPKLSEAQWVTERQAVADHTVSLADLLDRYGLALRSDWLRPWSRWITPEFEPRRYDTRFFVARCPAGQEIGTMSRESTQSRWLTADTAVRSADAGDLALLPPQYSTFLELYEFDSVADVFDAARPPHTVEPLLVRDGDGLLLDLPARLVDLGERVATEMYSTKDHA